MLLVSGEAPAKAVAGTGATQKVRHVVTENISQDECIITRTVNLHTFQGSCCASVSDMRHSMSHFCLILPHSEHPLFEIIAFSRDLLRCFFPSLTVLTEVKPWRREWSKRGPCHEPDSGHGHLAGVHEVHATTVRFTKEQFVAK